MRVSGEYTVMGGFIKVVCVQNEMMMFVMTLVIVKEMMMLMMMMLLTVMTHSTV